MEVIVKGNSMLPTLEDGQLVELKTYKEYKKGDIVAFQFHNSVYIKRIGYIEDDYFYAESDNSEMNQWGDRIYLTSGNYFGMVYVENIIGAMPRKKKQKGE